MGSTLPGSNETDRNNLIAMQNMEFAASLTADQKKEEDKQRKTKLLQERTRRVLVEPAVDEPHVIITVRHLSCGSKTRLFKADSKMAQVYDWAGSFSLDPENFELVDFRHHFIVFSSSLYMHEVDKPIQLSLEGEVAFNGFSVADDFEKLNKTRKLEHEAHFNNTYEQQ